MSWLEYFLLAFLLLFFFLYWQSRSERIVLVEYLKRLTKLHDKRSTALQTFIDTFLEFEETSEVHQEFLNELDRRLIAEQLEESGDAYSELSGFLDMFEEWEKKKFKFAVPSGMVKK